MANFENDGFNALLAAADEVEASLSVKPQASRACNSHIQEMLPRMTDSFSSQLSAMSAQMATLSERVDKVETGPSAAATPVPAHDSVSWSTGTPTSERILWCDRDLNEPPPNDAMVWLDEDPETETREEEQGCQLHRVSRTTKSLLKDAKDASTSWCQIPHSVGGEKPMGCQRATALNARG